jgi:hypothetical protein
VYQKAGKGKEILLKRNYQILIVLALVVVGVAVVFLSRGGQQTAQQTSTSTQMTQTTQTAQAGPDTVVPAGMSLEEYLEKYYQAYKEKRWKDAYPMLPASRKANESYDQYVTTLSGMPIDNYTVKPAEIDGSAAVVAVEVAIGEAAGGQLLQINWSFTKKNGKWVAEATKTLMR